MHRPTFAMLAELERTQWLSREGIEACQAQRLNQLLASALAHSPWHADRLRAAALDDAASTARSPGERTTPSKGGPSRSD